MGKYNENRVQDIINRYAEPIKINGNDVNVFIDEIKYVSDDSEETILVFVNKDDYLLEYGDIFTINNKDYGVDWSISHYLSHYEITLSKYETPTQLLPLMVFNAGLEYAQCKLKYKKDILNSITKYSVKSVKPNLNFINENDKLVTHKITIDYISFNRDSILSIGNSYFKIISIDNLNMKDEVLIVSVQILSQINDNLI